MPAATAAYKETFRTSNLCPLLKIAAAAAAAAALPARMAPIELKIGTLTLHPTSNKRSKAGLKTPPFRKVMIETSRALFDFASNNSHFCLGSFSLVSTNF